MTTTSSGSPRSAWPTSRRSAARTPRSARWCRICRTPESASRAGSRRPPTLTASSSPPNGLYDRIRRTVEALDVTRRRTSSRASARTCGSGSRSSRSRLRSRPTSATAYATLVDERPAAGVGVVGGALQRDRRRPAGCVVRGSAGDVPEHQRHREHPRRDPQRVRVAVQRPGDRVPRAPRLRPPRRRAVRGRPADGAIGCRGLRRAVHRRHRVRLRPRGVHHQLVRARRGGRAGRGEPGRVLRLQARPARGSPGDPEAVGGGEGREDGLRRRHATPAAAPCSPTSPRADRGAVQHHRRRGGGARPAGAGHRGPLRPADGHRVGQGRHRRRSSTSCRHAPRPSSRASTGTSRAGSCSRSRGR